MWTKRFFKGMNWAVAAGASLAALGLLAAVLRLSGYWPRDLLIKDMEGGLAKAPEADVLPRMQRLAELGEDGVAAVAGMLVSDDERIAGSAQVVLAEQLDQWRSLPVKDSALRAIHLARVLATLDPPRSPAAQRSFTDLGMQLLRWPAADRSQAEELAVHCERILITSTP